MISSFSEWQSRAVTASEAVAYVQDGMKVFMHGACASPTEFDEALAARQDLGQVFLYHLHRNGPAPLCDPAVRPRFFSQNLFVGPSHRKALEAGHGDFIPIFLSDIPWLFRSGKVELDVAMVQVSPPDQHGYCSLGVSVDAARAAVDSAKVVLGLVNHQMPRTHGAGHVHLSKFQAYSVVDRPLWEIPPAQAGEAELLIAEQVADMIEDGSTLQLGIGSISECVAARLHTKNDLGVHTEMFSDPIVDLTNLGVVTNARKQIHAGESVTSFVMGTSKVFDFVRDNPTVNFQGCDYTNDVGLIRTIDNMVAVNGAIEIDLSGQVCADSMGHQIFSGIGGQMDFIRGASMSKGGKPIIALPATAKNGQLSRIVT